MCAKEAVIHMPPKLCSLQSKVGHLIIVMGDWEQLHTNVTLLKPAKDCYSLLKAVQGHEKAILKSRPGYL